MADQREFERRFKPKKRGADDDMGITSLARPDEAQSGDGAASSPVAGVLLHVLHSHASCPFLASPLAWFQHRQLEHLHFPCFVFVSVLIVFLQLLGSARHTWPPTFADPCRFGTWF